jgi:hypothetical protein
MAAVTDLEEAALSPSSREGPRLSIVKPAVEPTHDELDDIKATREIETIEGPEGGEELPTAAQRIRQARSRQRPSFLNVNTTQGRIILLLIALVALAAIAGAATLLTREDPNSIAAVSSTPSVTAPPPTPTGLGDATATPPPAPTDTPAPPPPTDVIAVNGWVQVKAAGGLSIRADAGRTAPRVTVVRDGVKAHVAEGPKDADGLTWWRVDNFDPNDPSRTGWCAGQYLVPIPPP